MSYASVAEFVEAVGQADAKLLSGAAPAAARDDVRLLDALEDASAVLDTYLAARFPTLPITPVPRALRRAAIDIAAEILDRTGRSTIVQAADRARSWARDVSKGVATLGDAPGADPLPLSGGGPGVSAARPTFDDDSLSAYLPRFASGGGQ